MKNLKVEALKTMKVADLQKVAKEAKVKGYYNMKKEELVKELSKLMEQPPAPKQDDELKDNLITLKDIMGEIGLKDGKKARRILRNESIPKPGKRWGWDKKEKKSIQKVRTLLRTAM